MKISYVRGLEEDGAKFWLSRVSWEQVKQRERLLKKMIQKKHAM